MRVKSVIVQVLTATIALSACGGGGGTEDSTEDRVVNSTVPGEDVWRGHMLQYGRMHCDSLKNRNLSFDQKLAATYYDAQLVFYRIADYTGDKSWNGCAEDAEKIYRDSYVLPNRGRVPGYWSFAQGLTQDYLRTGDDASRRAVLDLVENAAFASDEALGSQEAAQLSREIAYALEAHIGSEDSGEAPRPRRDLLVQRALDALRQWTSGQEKIVKPFMVALTAEALIRYEQRTGDTRVLTEVAKAADWLWQNAWVANAGAFVYATSWDRDGGPEPAVDLNLLIAPMYGWLYHKTGDLRFAQRGDVIFENGVGESYLSNPKQFNQNYRWSIDYIRWRGGKD